MGCRRSNERGAALCRIENPKKPSSLKILTAALRSQNTGRQGSTFALRVYADRRNGFVAKAQSRSRAGDGRPIFPKPLPTRSSKLLTANRIPWRHRKTNGPARFAVLCWRTTVHTARFVLFTPHLKRKAIPFRILRPSFVLSITRFLEAKTGGGLSSGMAVWE